MLEPVEDETGAVAVPQSNLKRRLAIFAGLAIIAALTIWAIFTYAPGRSSSVEDDIVESTPLGLQQIVLEDDNGIVVQARSFSTEGGKLELMLEKGCQALPSEGIETFQWVNTNGDPLTAIRPSFPGNWRTHQICPTAAGGAMFATLLDDGVAISHVEPSGQTRWTQMVAVVNPNQSSVEMRVEDQFILLISHDESGGVLLIEAFDENGGTSWRQTIETGPSIEKLSSAQTNLGDVLVVWREPAIGIRSVILSPLGGVLQQSNLGDRPLQMRDAVQDELGQTLILYGDDQTAVELISRTNDRAWQRALDSTAPPLGALSYDASFFVFASVDDRLKIWGLDQFGAVSEVLNVQLLDRVLAGDVRHMNAVEAALTIQFDGSDPVDLILDLRRLNDALNFDPAAAVQHFDFPDEADTVSDLGVLEAQEAEKDPREMPTATETRELRADSIDEKMDALELEQSSSGAAPSAAYAESDQSSDLDKPIRSARLESTQVADTPTQARCMFSCISSDGSAIEYVLMQTVEVIDGESLTDVSLRLNETHENLCGLSGGEPVSEYTRECNPG